MEEWKPVAGYEDAYEVSSQGRVRSVERRCAADPTRHKNGRRVPAKILKFSPTRDGYNRVALFRDGEFHYVMVSRLVCEAWHGPPPAPELQAAHNDGNPANNVPKNLRWDTQSGNHLDKRKHGTAWNGNRSLTDDEVREFRKHVASGAHYRDTMKKFGVSKATYYNIVNRSSYGHIK